MASVSKEQVLCFSLCLIGDIGVGKSSLLHRFMKGGYTPIRGSTVGVDLEISTIPLEGKTIRLQIKDIAGIEKNRSVHPDVFKSAHGFIIVFDITSEKSFDGVNDWLLHLEKLGKRNATKILVGNKCDLQATKVIPSDRAAEFGNKWGMRFLEASAKDGTNVSQIFLGIAADINNRLYPQAKGSHVGAERLDITHRQEQIILKRPNLAESACGSNTNRRSQYGSALLSAPEDNPSQPCDYTFNLALIGDSGVGKSSLLVRFTEDRYAANAICTVPVDIRTKKMELEGRTVELLVRDTVGQENFRALTRSFYRGADGFMMVYDITNKKSFDSLPGWLQDLKFYAREDAVKILVGNKSDMTQERDVDSSSAQDFADHLGIPFLEASARSAENVEEIFKIIAELIIQRAGPPKKQNITGNENDTIRLTASRKDEKRTSCC